MDYLFLHRDKRTFTSERQRNLLFRAARLYWEQKYADSEVVPKRKVDCELYKYVLYYLEVRQVFLDPKLSLKKLSKATSMIFACMVGKSRGSPRFCILFIMLDGDFKRLFILSIGLRSCCNENSSFRISNRLSSAFSAQRYCSMTS